MKRNILFLVLLCLSRCFAEDTALGTLDLIEQNVLQLQFSNNELMLSNEKLKSILKDSNQRYDSLETITLEQSKLLDQWESNWQEMMGLYNQQSDSLKSLEFKYKALTISIPIVTAVVITATVLITKEVIE